MFEHHPNLSSEGAKRAVNQLDHNATLQIPVHRTWRPCVVRAGHIERLEKSLRPDCEGPDFTSS